MTDLRKAAEMALEVLDCKPESFVSWTDKLREAETREALRQALNYPTPEQIALAQQIRPKGKSRMGQALAQEPKKEWVGLTDEEGAEIWGDFYDIDYKQTVTPKELFKRIEAKLKEKNT